MTVRRVGTAINRLWRPIFVASLVVAFWVCAILLPLRGRPIDTTALITLCSTLVPFAALRTAEKRMGLANNDGHAPVSS